MGGLVLARLQSLLEQWISVCTKALYDVDWLGYPCWVNRYESIGKSHRRGVILAGICPIPWGMGSNPHWCKNLETLFGAGRVQEHQWGDIHPCSRHRIGFTIGYSPRNMH